MAFKEVRAADVPRAGGAMSEALVVLLLTAFASAPLAAFGVASSGALSAKTDSKPLHAVASPVVGARAHAGLGLGVLRQFAEVGVDTAKALAIAPSAAQLKTATAFIEGLAGDAIDGVPRVRSWELPEYWFGVYQDTILGQSLRRIVTSNDARQLRQYGKEAEEAAQLMRARGLAENPVDFHPKAHEVLAPTAELDELTLVEQGRTSAGARRLTMSWRTGYEPKQWLPGSERYRSFSQTDLVQAQLIRYDDSRPWVIMTHGFGMGQRSDLMVSGAELLSEALGVNVASVSFPFHGPRGNGLSDLQYAIGADVMTMLNAQSEGVHNVRQLMRWIEQEDTGQPIAAYGISMGGNVIGLLAGLEPGLAHATAVVPAFSFRPVIDSLRHHIGSRATIAAQNAIAPISPDRLPVVIPPERLHVHGGKADQITGAAAARRMADHFRSHVSWSPGGHLTAIPGAVVAVHDRLLKHLPGAQPTSTSRAMELAGKLGQTLYN